MEEHILQMDNVAWRALSGHQQRFSWGIGGIRRYRREIGAILAFADPLHPPWSLFGEHGQQQGWLKEGEALYCSGWDGLPAEGWTITDEQHLLRYGAPELPVSLGIREELNHAGLTLAALGTEAMEAMQQLADSCRPGPFSPGGGALGEYFGYWDGDKLVAMAGERMFAKPWREISSVCTLPAYRGRGLARSLLRLLLARQYARGERPFLHVMEEKLSARRLYDSLGFRLMQTTLARTVVWGSAVGVSLEKTAGATPGNAQR